MDDIGSANCMRSRIASWSLGSGVRGLFEVDRRGESSSWTTVALLLVLLSATMVMAGRERYRLRSYCGPLKKAQCPVGKSNRCYISFR